MTLVDTAGAAELAGVAPATIRQWRHRGYLKVRGRWGRTHQWDPREVLEVERDRRVDVVKHDVSHFAR